MKTVSYEGKELKLIQNAHLNQIVNDEPAYVALAVDEEGNEYNVKWEITAENTSEIEDESDMCDWSKYSVTPYIFSFLGDKK